MNAVPEQLRSWAEISPDAMLANLQWIRTKAGANGHLMAVLKADAYGQGLINTAKILDSQGLAFFGLANADEASRLADAGIQTRLFLLGPSFPAEREIIVQRDFVPCLSNMEEAESFASIAQAKGKKLRAHLAVDTGMGRGGFSISELDASLTKLLAMPQLIIEGIGSHLSSADEDPDFTRKQISQFEKQVARFQSISQPSYIHLSNSAGILGYEAGSCNLARPGLAIYGICPLGKYQEHLTPSMRLMSRVSIVRDLAKGSTVSYGHSFRSDKPMRTATVGIGYGDGYPRALSEKGAYVLIRGQKCPLLGRVTMDQIVVDVTQLPTVQAGDPVELFGPNLLVSQVAKWAGTIPWEILTGITPRVKRIFFD